MRSLVWCFICQDNVKQKIYFLRNVHLWCLDQARPSLVTTASASGAETRSIMFPLGRLPIFSHPNIRAQSSCPCWGFELTSSRKGVTRSVEMSVVSRVSCLSLGRLLCINSIQVPYLWKAFVSQASNQCCGSLTFWYGSGSVDRYHKHSPSDLDPAFFISGWQDAKFFCLLLFEGTFTSVFIDKKSKRSH